MKRTILVCTAAVVFAGSAWAQDKAAKPAAPAAAPAQGAGAQAGAPQGNAPAMDMTKMGPMARKPTNEKQTKKEITDFFKKMEETSQKGDMEAMNAMIDFPVLMVTDDLKGTPESKSYSREEYTAMMKPMLDSMPKDMKTTHKPTITVLSDSLAAVTDDFTMTVGKQKITGRNAGLLVKKDGQWKWKSMVEAGWGGMDAPGAGGSGQPAPTEGKQ
ncbi:nuclear transport factor 2 family protein [Hyalangium gracile]|uniref:nuclear transport factor 2 family protein n=1 Tax=Hyalangium gracile TaxID=394092 RepID=UPI001CCF5650|nr:nuclear transport factor 2 family protein [Hyalangium gracile]